MWVRELGLGDLPIVFQLSYNVPRYLILSRPQKCEVNMEF